MATDSPFEVECVDHVGAPVRDADAAIGFYRELGMPVVFDETLEEYPIRAVFLDVDGVLLELLEPIGPGDVKTFLERHGPGYQHVAYRVSSIDHAVQVLRDRGITFRSEEPLPGAGDSRIIFVEERHTAGLQVELVERD